MQPVHTMRPFHLHFIAICVLPLTLAAYCQLHSAFTSANVASLQSLGWGASYGIPLALVLAGLFACSPRVAAHADQPRMILIISFALAMALLVSKLVGDVLWRIEVKPLDLLASAYLAAPLTILAAFALMTAILLRHARRAGACTASFSDTAQSAPFVIPEAPDLHLRVEDVSVIRSAGNYCEIVTPFGTHLVRVTMKTMDHRLSRAGFQRVHKTTIIKLEDVRSIESSPSGRKEVRLACGLRVPLGRTHEAALRAALERQSAT